MLSKCSLSPLVYQLRQAKTEIVNASRVAYRFMAGLTVSNNNNNPNNTPDSPSNTNRVNMPRFQSAWLKNVVSPQQAKPSASGSVSPPDIDDDISPLHRQQHDGLATRGE